MTEPTPEDIAAEKWHKEKSRRMVEYLGDEHDTVMHAIIPFSVGGALDLYYFPNHIPGTGIATKELCEVKGEGSRNCIFENYEFVMFTRHKLALDDATNEDSPFGNAHQDISAILNPIAVYSAGAELNPHETCEFPADMDRIGGKCLIFDQYTPESKSDFGVMLILEIFRSEMEYARSDGGKSLLKKLRKMGHYPYSDLDRDPVF